MLVWVSRSKHQCAHVTFFRKTLHIPMLAFSSLFSSEDGLDGVLALFLPNSGQPAPRQPSTEHICRRR